MIRKIIKIDQEKCNGCGACAEACHEGAIDMAAKRALQASGKFIPWQVITISTDGKIID